MSDPMSIHCENARPLVPSYLDGELSEAQAGPLRQHLLACASCRSEAQDLKSLKKWFVSGESAGLPVAVPDGFASRVTRRAFAGDRGRVDPEDEIVLAAAPDGGGSGQTDGLLRFVLQVTSIAAALLIALSLALRAMDLPRSESLMAEESLEQVLDRLDALNLAAEEAALMAGTPPTVTGGDK